MPTGNQNQGRGSEGNSRNNGGSKLSADNLATNVKQGAETASNRLQEGYSAAKDQVADGYKQAGKVVTQNPASSVLVGLGVGFGIGLILSTILTHREETWAERNLPDSLLDLPSQFNKSRIARSLRNAPDALHGTFDHFSETLRDLPAAIARAIPKH